MSYSYVLLWVLCLISIIVVSYNAYVFMANDLCVKMKIRNYDPCFPKYESGDLTDGFLGSWQVKYICV